MSEYRITITSDQHKDEQFYVKAESIEEAAAKAARKLGDRRTWANRETGDPGKSGIFQGFRPIGHEGGNTSVGPNFHVFPLR